MRVWSMEPWSVDQEKRAVAQEIEEGERVATYRHLENRCSDRQIHIEELAKKAQRLAKAKSP